MTFIIKVLTLKMTDIIIAACELAKPGEKNNPNPCEPR